MLRQTKIQTILRLFCLLSVVNNGIPKDHFDSLRLTFLRCYGYQEFATLLNLQEAGLFRKNGKDLIDLKKLKSVRKSQNIVDIQLTF